MAGMAALRRGNSALAVALAADNGRNDWIFACRGHGYAVQRNAYDCHGLRRSRASVGTERSGRGEPRPYKLIHAVGSSRPIRLFYGPCRSRERACRNHSLRRCNFLLGNFHEALARRVSFTSPRGHCRFLRDGASLVHPLRPPKLRFFPHLHHRTQFQTLPHARIPTHSAILVLWRCSTYRSSSLDDPSCMVLNYGVRAIGAYKVPIAKLAFLFNVGPLLPSLFLHLEVKVARLYPFYNSGNGSPHDTLPIRARECKN